MKRREPDLDPELEAFLTMRKIVRAVPAEIRARALTRAKRIIATGGAIPAPPASARVLEWQTAPRGRPLVRLGLIGSVVLVAGTVGAVVAVHGRSAGMAPPPASDVARPEPARNEVTAGETDDPPPIAQQQIPVARVHRGFAERDSVAVELALLQRAQTAYGQHDCARALMLLAEHGRRFPQSRLAEERDALRVRSLSCAGHRQEAQRAAAEFAARFPRSVLLPRVGEGERAVE